MKKLRLKNVAVLDMRKATPESVAAVESVVNAGLVLVSPQTRQLAAQIEFKNHGGMLEIPGDVQPVMQNGAYTLTAEGMDKAAFLLVNGTLSIAPDVPADRLREVVLGGMVNGTVRASQSQMGALLSSGLSVSGASKTYPDGTVLRGVAEELTLAEARAAERPMYLTEQVKIEAGVPGVLEAKGLRLYGDRGAVIQESEAEAFYRVWRGEGAVLMLPEGFTLATGTVKIGRREAMMFRGRRMVAGDLFIKEDVGEAQLSGLEALIVCGRLFVPETLLERVLGLLQNEPELVPYTGTLVMFDGAEKLSAKEIALLPEKLAIFADGVLEFAMDAPAEILRERITLLYVDGLLQLSAAQRMALLPVMIVDGNTRVPDEEAEAIPEEEEAPEDVIVVKNSAIYIL